MGAATLFLCAYPLRAGASFKGKYQLDGEHTEYDVGKKVLCVDTAHSFPLLPFAYRHLNVQCRWMGRPATVFFFSFQFPLIPENVRIAVFWVDGQHKFE